MKATFDQASHLLQLVREKLSKNPTCRDCLQELFDSGLLADVLEAGEPESVDRDKLRKILGLKALPVPRPFNVDVNLTQNVHDMLTQTLWRFQCKDENFPRRSPHSMMGRHRAVCVPVFGHNSMSDLSVNWQRRGYTMADFRETLATALATDASKAFVCAELVPIIASMEVTERGTNGHNFVIIRNKAGIMYLTTEVLPKNLSLDDDSDHINFRTTGEGYLPIKKRDVFTVLLRQKK